MCPVCVTTAALIAGKVTSAGGLAAIVIKKFGVKNALDDKPRLTSPEPLGSNHLNEGRDQDVNEHD